MTLEELRKQIDAVDLELVELLNKRARIALEIGRYKAANQLPVTELAREKVVYSNAHERNKGPMPNSGLTQIFERVMDVMRALQRNELARIKQAEADAEAQATGTSRPETGIK